MKQKGISQILLKIVTLIFGNDMNFGYRQAGLAEMGCHIKESIILLDRRATYADQGFRTCQPEVGNSVIFSAGIPYIPDIVSVVLR